MRLSCNEEKTDFIFYLVSMDPLALICQWVRAIIGILIMYWSWLNANNLSLRQSFSHCVIFNFETKPKSIGKQCKYGPMFASVCWSLPMLTNVFCIGYLLATNDLYVSIPTPYRPFLKVPSICQCILLAMVTTVHLF